MSARHYDFDYDNYDEDSFEAEEPELPYDDGLVMYVQALDHLKRLDIGYGDDDGKSTLHELILSREALWAISGDLEDQGGK